LKVVLTNEIVGGGMLSINSVEGNRIGDIGQISTDKDIDTFIKAVN
jgi:hypothetical protein